MRSSRASTGLRDEGLIENWFVSLADAQQTIEAWRIEYNTFRPHSQLRDLAPNDYASQLDTHSRAATTPTGLT
jgi:putative transposase